MRKSTRFLSYLLIGTAVTVGLATSIHAQAVVADHTSVAHFAAVPDEIVRLVRDHFTIYYGHTSHGSQIVTGMTMLMSEDTLFSYGAGTMTVLQYGDDLGTRGDTTWMPPTRAQLDPPGSEVNLVMWSWCGGVSDNDSAGIVTYLEAMNQLEQQYPGVTFVYMTGHLDGGGTAGNLYVRNNQIRQYCLQHGKKLFDFADIESYAPDGTYYPDESDACGWCSDWCATYSCPDCAGCAHSHCFNCYQKGKAFWWFLARLTGWTEGPCCVGLRGNVDGDNAELVDISDLSVFVDYLFGGQSSLYCLDETDLDVSGSVDVSDLQMLIDFLFFDGPLSTCD